ncbi:hypothetical protein CUP0742 [Campylobacter upsaliensis RM3195]|nr:hypothetical protein CUP0742 [Campylobacter upsaliensis RM3195]
MPQLKTLATATRIKHLTILTPFENLIYTLSQAKTIPNKDLAL